jgi:arginase
MERRLTLVGAPICTLAKFSGMRHFPAKLRELGLVRRLQALGLDVRDEGDAELPELRGDQGPEEIKNLAPFMRDTRILADKISGAYSEGLLLLLGGECSLILGSVNALAPRLGGKAGVLWFDAHGDFNTPETSPSGYIGGMCLALACGRGAHAGQILQAPPLDEACIVHVGSRALDELEREAMLSSEMRLFSAGDVKRLGAAKVASEARRLLDARASWIILHLDVDVLDPKFISPIWPSVNYPAPGGLNPSEVLRISREVLKAGKVRALHVTAYNAALDRDGSSGRNLIALIAELLRPI